MKTEDFSLLRNRGIIDILDGDKQYGNYEFDDCTTIGISMPRLSGNDICNLSTLFGLPVTYSWNGGALSRWQYLDNLLDYCIKNNKCSSLLTLMFSLDQFSKKISAQHTPSEIKEAHKVIVQTILAKINELLLFSGNKLIVIENDFMMCPTEDKVQVAIPKIKTIDREYIKSISSRAMKDIEQNQEHYWKKHFVML